jgi:hypothetical protein
MVAGLLTVRFWPKEVAKEEPKQVTGTPPRKPRFMTHKTPAFSVKTSRPSGFYAQQPFARSSGQQIGQLTSQYGVSRTIIHYIDAQQRALFVSRLNETRLRLASQDEISLKSSNQRIHLSRASAIFEIAALEQIEQDHYADACRLLVDGINHDLAFKNLSSGGLVPSLRLFDLLAAVAVRRQDTQYEKELFALAQKSRSVSTERKVSAFPAPDLAADNTEKQVADNTNNKIPANTSKPVPSNTNKEADEDKGGLKPRKTLTTALDSRVHKWNDANGSWRKRMLNPKQTVAWKMTIAPDTTLGKNKTKRIEIKSGNVRSTEPG